MPIYIENDYYPMDSLTDFDSAYALHRNPIKEMQTLAPDPDRGKTGLRFRSDEPEQKKNNNATV